MSTEMPTEVVLLRASPELIAQMREWSGPFQARIQGPDAWGVWQMELRTTSPMPVDNPVDNSCLPRSGHDLSVSFPVDNS